MWKSYSLRTRLGIFLGAMFLLALAAGLLVLREFAGDQLIQESEPAARASEHVAEALNETLARSADPQGTLDAFVGALNRSGPETIHYRPLDAPASPAATTREMADAGGAPMWFVRLLNIQKINRRIPILIGDRHVGDLSFEPRMVADIHEKWLGFLAIVGAGVGLMVMTLGIIFFTLDQALRPLLDLSNGLMRLRAGNYTERIPGAGPPEIRRSCEAANELAATLTVLNRENRELLRRVVNIQDDERRHIAREIHDELGPLLFAIRANAVAIVDGDPALQTSSGIETPAQRILLATEALQSTNRRILDHLRPLHIEELGLDQSIRKMLRDLPAHPFDITAEIDPAIEDADPVILQTIFRVFQDAVTNSLRHSGASQVHLRADLRDGHALIEARDNGNGLPADISLGRGLTGMRERVRALSGTLDLFGDDGGTCVRCRLPVEPPAGAAEHRTT